MAAFIYVSEAKSKICEYLPSILLEVMIQIAELLVSDLQKTPDL